MTLTKIRDDLKEIRYYYSRKTMFDNAVHSLSVKSVLEKVRKYDETASIAPLWLYDLYISLYVNNLTQEALAHELGYTPEHIQRQNKKLLVFLQEKLS